MKDKTQGRIPSLLAARDIKPLTRFALVNAIYLKAAWARAFSPDDTVSAPFRLASGRSVRVPTMVGPKEMGWVRYATGSGWRAAELPYIGGKLAMTVILPDTLKAFEKSMTRKWTGCHRWQGREGAAEAAEPQVPSTTLELRGRSRYRSSRSSPGRISSRARRGRHAKRLHALVADFTGIADPAKTGEAPLYLSKAIHQAIGGREGHDRAASTAILGDGWRAGDQVLQGQSTLHLRHP